MKGQTNKTLKQTNSSFKEITNVLQIYNEKLAWTCCFLKKKKFMYLLAALGLCCCQWAFSSCGECGLLSPQGVCRLIAVVFLVKEHRLQVCGPQQLRPGGLNSCSLWAPGLGLSSCGTWAQLLCGMQDLPIPGIKPMSLALKGRFLTIGPPGKPLYYFLI